MKKDTKILMEEFKKAKSILDKAKSDSYWQFSLKFPFIKRIYVINFKELIKIKEINYSIKKRKKK